MDNAQLATEVTCNLRVTSVASCTFFQQKSRDERISIKNIYRRSSHSLSAWIKSGLTNPQQQLLSDINQSKQKNAPTDWRVSH